jgi:hypothetical protein
MPMTAMRITTAMAHPESFVESVVAGVFMIVAILKCVALLIMSYAKQRRPGETLITNEEYPRLRCNSVYPLYGKVECVLLGVICTTMNQQDNNRNDQKKDENKGSHGSDKENQGGNSNQ